MNVENPKACAVRMHFVALKTDDLLTISREFERFFGNDATLKLQPKSSSDDSLWASGFMNLDSIRLRVYLAPLYIDFSGAPTTDAELRFIRERDGLTDTFELRLNYAEGESALAVRALSEKLQSLTHGFLKSIKAIPWDGKLYAREDYPESEWP